LSFLGQAMATTQNRLLLLLIDQLGEQADANVDQVTLQRGSILCDAGDDLQFAYFPEDCVLSLLSVLIDGTQVETATIGNEGGFGALASMGCPIASSRCMVQVEGAASRVPTRWLRQACVQVPFLSDLFVRYAQITIFQIQQSAACNALHPVEKRLARWLLEMSDRGDTERLALTHEFLAGILGANRATISIAAAALQDAGHIVYRRGTIDIQDRLGLEAACCECYAAVSNHAEAIWKSTK
jgi:CRP-like cAMP-binding protein